MDLQHQSPRVSRNRWFGRSPTPTHLRQVDQHLLKTAPLLWSLRLHHAACFGIIGVSIAFLLSALIPLGRPHIFPTYMSTVKWGLIAAQSVAALYWLWQQRQFSMVHLFSKQEDPDGYAEFFGYVAGFMLIFSALPVFYASTHVQLQLRTDRTQLAQDMLLLHMLYDDGDRPHTSYLDMRVTRLDQLAYLNEILPESALDRLHIFGWSYFILYEVNSAEVRTFIEKNLTSADINIIANPANDPFLEAVARNGGFTGAEVETAIKNDFFKASQYPTHFRDQWQDASKATFQQFRFGFDSSQPFLRNTLLTSVAATLHLAMAALLIKHLDRRTLRRTAVILLSSPLVIVAAFFLHMAAAHGDEALFVPIFMFVTLIATSIIAKLGTRAARIIQDQRRSQSGTLALALLPYATVLLSFMLILLLKVFEFDGMVRNEWAYSLRGLHAPYWYVELISQLYFIPLIPFAYPPLVPFMKRRLTRLAALPAS